MPRGTLARVLPAGRKAPDGDIRLLKTSARLLLLLDTILEKVARGTAATGGGKATTARLPIAALSQVAPAGACDWKTSVIRSEHWPGIHRQDKVGNHVHAGGRSRRRRWWLERSA